MDPDDLSTTPGPVTEPSDDGYKSSRASSTRVLRSADNSQVWNTMHNNNSYGYNSIIISEVRRLIIIYTCTL